jgi:hypothetical protein
MDILTAPEQETCPWTTHESFAAASAVPRSDYKPCQSLGGSSGNVTDVLANWRWPDE